MSIFRPGALRDDRGRAAPREPKRIVSLVPSDTYTLVRLGVGERLVGRTRYCVEPLDTLESIPSVGGTKDPDVEAICDLRPDVVFMNQEENTQAVAEKLEAAGVTLFVSFPRRLAAGAALVARFLRLLGDPEASARELVKETYEKLRLAEVARAQRSSLRVFCPIWADPWMTLNGETFISDVLAHLGCENVFQGRARKFPLRADLGEVHELAPERTAGKDTRYPRVSLEEVASLAPELILLPDEPYEFGESEAATLRALDTPASKSGRIHFVRGKSLMWPGLMSLEGFAELDEKIRAGESS